MLHLEEGEVDCDGIGCGPFLVSARPFSLRQRYRVRTCGPTGEDYSEKLNTEQSFTYAPYRDLLGDVERPKGLHSGDTVIDQKSRESAQGGHRCTPQRHS